MKKELNGLWKVTHVPFGADIGAMLREDFVPEGWLDAHVPEEIHATLRKAGLLRGATYDKPDDEERWVEACDWVYSRVFVAPEGKGEPHLVFEGLDGFCEVYLNGQRIGKHANMHRPLDVAVGGVLREGTVNRLLVRCISAVKAVEGRDARDCFSITESDRLFARKAQMNYGWDFCGRTVTAGIWKDVYLTRMDGPKLDTPYVWVSEATAERAVVHIQASVKGEAEGMGLRIAASLSLNGVPIAGAVEHCWAFKEGVTLEVPQPELWWPQPYGEQPLYELTLRLYDHAERDFYSQKLGLRTIEVEEVPCDDGGLSFRFVVNGRRLFIRGANWVPVNAIYTDITDEDYQLLFHDAVEGRISMLRVWGGGIYEPDIFYDLCDAHGILVWQDFMLACGIYPQDQDFLDEMEQEAEHVICRYRNRTALALWSGDNENGQAYIWACRAYEFPRDAINHEVLKEACETLDPHRYFLPTSPGSPHPELRGGDNQESPYQGDMHLYIMSGHRGETWHRDYGKDYYKRVLGYRPRFISEFGFISLPEKASFYQFNPKRDALHDPSELLKFLPMIRPYVEANDVDAMIHYSQLFNAQALKYWIEYFRSLKGTCSGTLYWKFNDPLTHCPDIWMYPSHMSSVDMYHRRKMNFYVTRRAYADVLVAFVEDLNGGLAVYGMNETAQPVRGLLRVERRRLDGTVLSETLVPVEISTDRAVKLMDVNEVPEDAASEVLVAVCTTQDDVLENRYYYLDVNAMDQLKLPEGRFTAEVRREGCTVRVKLRAETYLHTVRVDIPDTLADYSDNYFDMDPGTEREIVICVHRAACPMEEALLQVRPWNGGDCVIPLGDVAEG